MMIDDNRRTDRRKASQHHKDFSLDALRVANDYCLHSTPKTKLPGY